MKLMLSPLGANQTEVTTPGAVIFFSYQTPVAARIGGEYYKTEKKWSVTTSRHIGSWLDGHLAVSKPQSFFDNLANS